MPYGVCGDCWKGEHAMCGGQCGCKVPGHFNAASQPVKITVRRERQYPVIARPGPAWRWVYAYTTPVDVTHHYPDGTSGPGPRAGEFITYGTHLASLRDMLRRKYGRNVVITETWKAAA